VICENCNTFEQYLSLTLSHLRWYALGEDRPKDLRSNEPPDFKKVVAKLEEYDIFDADLTGADAFEQASHIVWLRCSTLKRNFTNSDL
jgi:hypothetical protein